MNSSKWSKLHPIRWKRIQRAYRERNRLPCQNCGTKMPFPSPGRKYCDGCQPLVRKRILQRFRLKRFAELAKYKLKRGCKICGYNKCASALQFHHKEGEQKEHRVWVPRGKEFKKCVLLCANCHFKVHEDKKKEENGEVFP